MIPWAWIGGPKLFQFWSFVRPGFLYMLGPGGLLSRSISFLILNDGDKGKWGTPDIDFNDFELIKGPIDSINNTVEGSDSALLFVVTLRGSQNEPTFFFKKNLFFGKVWSSLALSLCLAILVVVHGMTHNGTSTKVCTPSRTRKTEINACKCSWLDLPHRWIGRQARQHRRTNAQEKREVVAPSSTGTDHRHHHTPYDLMMHCARVWTSHQLGRRSSSLQLAPRSRFKRCLVWKW